MRPAMALNGAMPHRLPRNYRTLASLSRINLLHELQQRGAQTVAELAVATGLHHNTAREHLHRLIDAGFVSFETVPSAAKGRPKILYRAATGRDDPTQQARRRAAEQRTEQLRRLLPLVTIGAERSGSTRQIEMLDDHMDQCGFDSEIDFDSSRMTMHDCPFAGLARDNPQVCEVHFALVRDALQLVDGPLEAGEFHPFAGPHHCTVELHDGEPKGSRRAERDTRQPTGW
jgi:predicted ArsR family transcriptional regulator